MCLNVVLAVGANAVGIAVPMVAIIVLAVVHRRGVSCCSFEILQVHIASYL